MPVGGRQGQPVAVAVVHLGHRGRGGPQQLPLPVLQAAQPLLQRLPETDAGPQHARLVGPRGGDEKNIPEGGLLPQLAQLHLGAVEVVVVLPGGEPDHVMLGGVGLDQSPARLLSPARPAHHLGEQGEGALPRPEVVHEQGLVRQDDPHQGDVLKVQPLGHHLGPHQNGHVLLLKLLQNGLVGPGGGDGVRVHAQDGGLGEELLELLLDLLGAHPDEVEPSAAHRAGPGQGLGVAAVVAHEPSVGRVVGELHRAPWALGHVAALPAGHHSAGPPAVQEQDGLLPPHQVLLQLLPQGAADGGAVARPQLLLHVHDVDLGQGLLVVALPQGEAAVAAALGGVHGLHRRGGRAQQQQGVLLHAAVLGHLPGMVAGVVLRLIAGLLLLVQDDES